MKVEVPAERWFKSQIASLTPFWVFRTPVKTRLGIAIVSLPLMACGGGHVSGALTVFGNPDDFYQAPPQAETDKRRATLDTERQKQRDQLSPNGANPAPFIRLPSGYPFVAGSYNLETGTYNLRPDTRADICLHRFAAPRVRSRIVLQAENALTVETLGLVDLDALKALGYSFVSDSGTFGVLGRDGQFTVLQGLTLTHNTFGIVHFNGAMTGTFFPTGWSGNLAYTIRDDAGTTSCTYTTSFYGMKE